jgi:hypothetical protein
MKKSIAIFFLMCASQLYAQNKIELFYGSAALLITGQGRGSNGFKPSYDLGLSCNYKKKNVLSAGFSNWKENEKKLGSFMFGPRHIQSEHVSIHLLGGRYIQLSPKAIVQCQLGPSFIISEKLYNFHLEQNIYSGGWFVYSSPDWKYNVKTEKSFGLLLRLDYVLKFKRYGGFLLGMDLHTSSDTQKLNLRIAFPFGYFQ